MALVLVEFGAVRQKAAKNELIHNRSKAKRFKLQLGFSFKTSGS